MNSQPISLKLIPERTVVRDDETSEVDIVVEVQSSMTEATLGRKALNMCLVIDQSGSMTGDKLETAKRSAIDIFGRLQEGDLLTIVTFNDEARVITNPRTPKADVSARIKEIQASGSTNLSLGWHLGLLELQTYQTDIHANRLIILSDGQANAGETKKSVLGKESAKARDLGITTSTIGIGRDFQEDILDALAAESGGRFWFIEDSRIEEILNVEFQGALSIIIERPRLALNLPSGVRISEELNDVRKVADRYRIRPISGNYLFNLAVRLEITPEQFPERQIPIGAALFDGDAPIADTSCLLQLDAPKRYVVAPTNAVVASVVQQYQTARNNEVLRDKLDEGEFTFIKDMIIQEIDGMRVVQDKLRAEAGDALYDREGLRMGKKMRRRSAMYNLADLCDALEFIGPTDAETAAGIQILVPELRKIMVSDMHSERIRGYEMETSVDSAVKSVLERGLAILSAAVARHPDDLALRDIERRIRDELVQFNW